jgi:hypothetical protein
MPSFVDHINEISTPLFEAVNDGYIPFEYTGLTEGMTGFNSHGQDAFGLNPPIAGRWVEARQEPGIDIDEQPVGDRFILRTIIGYAMAAQSTQNSQIFYLRVANLINSMMIAAYKVYGSRILRLTFDRPVPDGLSQEYFRELEHSAGYELRLYGELQPAVLSFPMEDVENE